MKIILQKLLFYFKDKKTKAVYSLYSSILDKLQPLCPSLYNYTKHFRLHSIIFGNAKEGLVINVFPIANNFGYLKINLKEKDSDCIIYGFKILEKHSQKYSDVIVVFVSGKMSRIIVPHLPFPDAFEISSLKCDNLKTEPLNLNKEEKEIVLKILKGVPEEKLKLTDWEETWEREIRGKNYYKIIMFEGDKEIAVDKTGKVFLLFYNNQGEEDVVPLHPNIISFLGNYDGDKKSLDAKLEEIKNKSGTQK